MMPRSSRCSSSRSRRSALLDFYRPAILPLFVAEELQALDRIERERADLRQRIRGLPPRSHRRIVLEARLAELTVKELRLETATEGL